MARLRTRLEASTGALQQAVETYATAIRESLRREQEILRLRVHVAENILHYMHAIWEYEVLDQRYFALHDVPVPKITGTLTKEGLDVVLDPEAGELPLAAVADLDNLLGFKGNYLMFPLRKDNPLTTLMANAYRTQMLDQASLNRLVASAPRIARNVEAILDPSNDGEGSATARELAEAWQVVSVPSGHLHIEALAGSKPVLEDFKLRHRHADWLDALADVSLKETDSLRRLLRLLAGDLSDPDVEGRFVQISTGDGHAGTSTALTS